jgi:transposase-like protein
MGQVLHGGATTTEAIRRAIQNSQASLRALSRRYGINQKTVAKWKKRTSVEARGDFLRTKATFLRKPLEHLELVSGMHVFAGDILVQAGLDNVWHHACGSHQWPFVAKVLCR